MHSGGNESWVSPACRLPGRHRPRFNQPFKITFTGAGNYLLCGYVQGDFSTFASGELRGAVAPDATDASPGDDAHAGSTTTATAAAMPAVVRRPWITRKRHVLTCHAGTWSNKPTSRQLSLVRQGARQAVASGQQAQRAPLAAGPQGHLPGHGAQRRGPHDRLEPQRCAPAESHAARPAWTSRAGCWGRAAARVAAMGEPPVGTITLLFTDIEGSTRLARATGAVWQDVLAAHHEAVARAIERHGGYVEAIQGDGFVAAFADARAAVDAALDAQRALAAAAWPRGIEPLRVRMGVHTGYVERTELGYVGLEVHRAARVGAAANGGQILVTAATRALLRDETEIEDLGEHRLKDFPRPQRLFHVVRDGCHAAEFGPLDTAAGAADEPARGPHGARGPRPRARPSPGAAGGRGPVRDPGRRGRGGQDAPRARARAPAARRSARRRVRGRARAGQRSRRRPARRRPRARARRRRRRTGAPPRGAAGRAAVAARARQLRADPARRSHRRRAARTRSRPARARHQPGAAARARRDRRDARRARARGRDGTVHRARVRRRARLERHGR